MATPYTDADVEIATMATATIWPGTGITPRQIARAVLDALAAAGRLVPADDDPRHIIEIRPEGWTIQHPLACRLSGDLFACPVNRAAETELGTRRCPPPPPGRYECRVGDRDLAGLFLILGRVDPERTTTDDRD